ncbi:MAG: phage recombination protein Bet [Candidatus Kuenenia sp.]|nr:phage recombination protein Bet [Candidatus Kuenenia sp.]
MSNELVTQETGVELTLDIIKKYICPLATEQEAYFFLQLCKAQRLNPFLREAYLIKYENSPATMVVGKETFTKRADKLPQYDGFKAGIIVSSGEKIQYREGSFYTSSEILLGGWAEVYRNDRKIPFRNEVKLEEYIGRKKDGTITKMWAEKTATMIRKVPLMQSLREAFPDYFGGFYSVEEINTIDSLPTYEMGKPPVVLLPAQVKTPQSKSVNAANPSAVQDNGIKIITGIEKITAAKGKNKTSGAEYTIYKVLGEGGIVYSTFDEKLATLAKSAKEAGLEIEISHKGDKYNTITAIDIVEPGPETEKETPTTDGINIEPLPWEGEQK